MTQRSQKIAIIGAGISGLASAYFLQKHHEVSLFEANTYLGGHTNTVDIQIDQKTLSVDTGFLVFNEKTYPNLIALFAELGVDSYATDMSFGVSLNDGQLEWAGTNLDTVFAQRKNILSPGFLRMLSEILRFNRDAESNLRACSQSGISLGQLLSTQKYNARFANHYLIPMAAAIWSSSPKDILDFPASTFLRFCLNHALLQVNDRPQWRTVKNGARSYVQKIAATLKDIRLNNPVSAVVRTEAGVQIESPRGIEQFDAVIFATHAPDTLRLLKDPSEEETALLSKVRYQANTAYLHTDVSLLPRNKKVWSAWNYLGTDSNTQNDAQAVCVSYLLNQLQRLDTETPVIVTLNPWQAPAADKLLASFNYDHPVFDQAAIESQRNLSQLQGKRATWFAGAWSGYGFHEDGLKSALRVVNDFQLCPNWASLD
ncbi:NAD(P)/FAD-dependent oxidoreductase [Undibacterium flavidum]|uniref:FAD-dependent oxidoreductase n=1 Tax=Undibacterium flavidum TaxID=2762297 RepID=A0ABR6YFW6_9BURK|nr:FAD-dependent oxidoreductase [Undibacterium flavidum]MBC3875459.1 FAD-dependent oxidoreductase [Undibacterium flavidum]